MHSINTELFYFFNGLAGHFSYLDISIIFLTTYLVEIVFVLVGIYMIVWFPFVHTPPSLARLSQFFYALEMGFALVFTWVFVKVLKFIIAHPRPFEVLLESQQLISISGGDSFPSGHAAMTMALATTVYYKHHRLGLLLFAFAILVAFSRMYVGVHYPLDVLCGILIGLIIPKLLNHIFEGRTV